MCVCLHTHLYLFVCPEGVILDGFMICKDVCHIGSGGKQYPLCNRRRKASLSLSLFSLSLSLFLSFSGFMSFLSFSVSLSSTNARTFSYGYRQAMNAVMPCALWSVEHCLPV